MKINHIGYMVGDLAKAIQSFEALGYHKVNEIVEDTLRKISICFLEQGGYCIELVCPKDECAVIYKTYKKMGNTPYHICYEVKDLIESVEKLKKQGYILTQPIEPAIAFDGRRVAFLFQKAIGLIELVETQNL